MFSAPFVEPLQRTPSQYRNDQGPFIKVGRRGRAHRSMGDINRAGNMASPVGFRGSCIDKKNLVSLPKSLVKPRREAASA